MPPRASKHKDAVAYLESVQADERSAEPISVDDLDVLVMRNDPADDAVERPWAVTSGILFGQLSVTRGTLVVNDPDSLANAVNKTYFQQFPEAVRPPTLISRDVGDIADFIDAMGGQAVLKPLQGSGGTGVFFVSSDESPNLNQMIEAVGRDGYVVAQEVLPDADDGDVRLFVMNGEPLMAGSHHAAFRRVNKTADKRSNMRVGGEAERVKVDRRHARGRRGRATQAHRRRHVPRRARHRGRQAGGGQRVQPRRPRQLRDPSTRPASPTW